MKRGEEAELAGVEPYTAFLLSNFAMAHNSRRFVVLEHDDSRILIERPSSYAEALRVTRHEFGLRDSDSISLFCNLQSTCEGSAAGHVEIRGSGWEFVNHHDHILLVAVQASRGMPSTAPSLNDGERSLLEEEFEAEASQHDSSGEVERELFRQAESDDFAYPESHSVPSPTPESHSFTPSPQPSPSPPPSTPDPPPSTPRQRDTGIKVPLTVSRGRMQRTFMVKTTHPVSKLAAKLPEIFRELSNFQLRDANDCIVGLDAGERIGDIDYRNGLTIVEFLPHYL
ncbi:hypothetical protein BKA62DRAFT_445579 [Auriculariales sp. MPI-PUGE-AT-0066]|nr:hypothetical protein BKA62DRAFT_445579 [Auriculariales sp. MPI-PUGE-AT-0066]